MSLSPVIQELARQLKDARAFDSTSAMIEQLVREDYERRIAPMVVVEPPAKLEKKSKKKAS